MLFSIIHFNVVPSKSRNMISVLIMFSMSAIRMLETPLGHVLQTLDAMLKMN